MNDGAKPRQALAVIDGSFHDDGALCRLARVDRSRAYEAVVHRYRDALFHHAALILRDWDEAIDVVQEVFIRAVREPRFFDADFKRKAWLYQVTSNRCLNIVRDRKRRHHLLQACWPRASEETDALDLAFHSQQQERIFSALDRLSEEHREVLTLRYYADLSIAEISDTLQLKVGTVMSRIARARARLLSALDGINDTEASTVGNTSRQGGAAALDIPRRGDPGATGPHQPHGPALRPWSPPRGAE